jgi:hypothetical protein
LFCEYRSVPLFLSVLWVAMVICLMHSGAPLRFPLGNTASVYMVPLTALTVEPRSRRRTGLLHCRPQHGASITCVELAAAYKREAQREEGATR